MTAGAPFQIGVSGGELHGHALGDGPPVVFIHGTAPAIWGELPALLAADHRTITYDRRSFGASAATQPRNLTTHAADAAEVIRACGTPATVIGWSIGGVIAMEVAATNPELVSGMVLLEPPLHAKRHPRPRMVAAIAGATVLGRLGRPEAGARRFLSWALGRRDGTTDLATMPPEWHARLAAGDAAAIVRELAAGTGEHLDATAVHRITTPTRLLRGDASQRVFADAARRSVEAIDDAKLIDVPGSGHALQLDAPHAVRDSVAAVTA